MDKAYTVYAPSEIIRECGMNFQEDDRVVFEEGALAVLDKEHFYIKVVGTIPLRAFEDGLQFGFWVEISKDDFNRFFDANEDDELYMKYVAEGTLANDWPGFEGTEGLKVKVRPIKLDRGLYVTEVSEAQANPLFTVAINASVEDDETKQKVKKLVDAFYEDMHNNNS